MNGSEEVEVVAVEKERLRRLETPREIVEAIADLSRRKNGEVMVFMAESGKEDEGFWFHPLQMQQEMDNPRSYGNIRVKLHDGVEYENLRIREVERLEVDRSSPLMWMEAVDRFAKLRGYEVDKWRYATCLVRRK